MVTALAASLATPGEEGPRGEVRQVVNVTGSGNDVKVSGRDLYVGHAPERAAEDRPAPPRFTVLFAAACPDDRAELRLDRELAALQEALALSRMRDTIRLETRMSVQPVAFVQALVSARPRVVHFAGHGSADGGELYFEDAQGRSHAAPARGLHALFAAMEGIVECVVLNACYTRRLAEAILPSVPFVVGMNGRLHDDSAITFTRGFYIALGEGRGIPEAHGLGVAMMRLMRAEGEEPVLDRAGG
jgi:hypothetical protein